MHLRDKCVVLRQHRQEHAACVVGAAVDDEDALEFELAGVLASEGVERSRSGGMFSSLRKTGKMNDRRGRPSDGEATVIRVLPLGDSERVAPCRSPFWNISQRPSAGSGPQRRSSPPASQPSADGSSANGSSCRCQVTPRKRPPDRCRHR